MKTREQKRNQTRKLTVCSMLAALGVVLLWLGSIVEVVDISMAVIASLLCVFAVIEYGKGAPWMVFAVTAILSLILVPQKTPAVMYAVFFGYYPILKEKIERLPRLSAWLIKEAVFNVALVLMLFLSRALLFGTQAQTDLLYLAVALLAELVFPIYDIALTRLISLYVYHLRDRFRIK